MDLPCLLIISCIATDQIASGPEMSGFPGCRGILFVFAIAIFSSRLDSSFSIGQYQEMYRSNGRNVLL